MLNHYQNNVERFTLSKPVDNN